MKILGKRIKKNKRRKYQYVTKALTYFQMYLHRTVSTSGAFVLPFTFKNKSYHSLH
jgi:hypothetical protein